jgi:cystathionine beta-lyase/cystathionine gamma-synthase
MLARALRGVEVEPLDDELGRAAGVLLARTGMADAIDAAVVALAEDGDRILTSDPDDIDRLVEAAGLDVEVVPV